MYIYYCRKQGYKCFEDYIDSLSIIRKKIIYENNNELLKLKFNDEDIHIFRYYLPPYLIGKHNVFVLNTEQMSEKNRLNYILSLLKEKIQVIDYSIVNINILRKYGKYSNLLFYIPYQYNKKEVSFLKSLQTDNYTYDIGIVNCSSIYRKKIFNKLISSNLKVIDIRGWKNNRDTIISKCKILLNIHFQPDFKIYESIRCDRWLFANKCIVSEICNNIELIDVKNNIIFIDSTNITDFISNIKNIIHNHTNNHTNNNFDLKKNIKFRWKCLKYFLDFTS